MLIKIQDQYNYNQKLILQHLVIFKSNIVFS